MQENSFELPGTNSELLDALEAEDGTTPAERVSILFKKRNHILGMVVNDVGKFRVLGIDRYDNDDWVAGEFDSAEEAISYAKKNTDEAKPLAGDASMATVYYAYTPNGDYLGRDTWKAPQK